VTEPREGEAMWKFAIMFQIGMIIIGVVLIVIGISASAVAPIALGAVFIAIAGLGIRYSRRALAALRG
jgi:hypothetical protein